MNKDTLKLTEVAYNKMIPKEIDKKCKSIIALKKETKYLFFDSYYLYEDFSNYILFPGKNMNMANNAFLFGLMFEKKKIEWFKYIKEQIIELYSAEIEYNSQKIFIFFNKIGKQIISYIDNKENICFFSKKPSHQDPRDIDTQANIVDLYYLKTNIIINEEDIEDSSGYFAIYGNNIDFYTENKANLQKEYENNKKLLDFIQNNIFVKQLLSIEEIFNNFKEISYKPEKKQESDIETKNLIEESQREQLQKEQIYKLEQEKLLKQKSFVEIKQEDIIINENTDIFQKDEYKDKDKSQYSYFVIPILAALAFISAIILYKKKFSNKNSQSVLNKEI